MSKFLLPPGFKDEIFEQAILEHKYKNKIINLFVFNGYELVKPPLVEYVNSKNTNNAFIFKEKKESKGFIFRNDITLQISRLANARLKNKTRPLKLCYYGEVIRKKGTMLRPERQFLQVGAECIGEENYLADVEMLDLAYQALAIVGIKDVSIDLSSSEFLNFLLKKIKNKKNLEAITTFIKRKDLKNCLQYIDRFDPEKSSNPFAYFTQIIYYAFVRRITKEKKQQQIKEKLLKQSNIEERIALQAHEDGRDYQQQFVDMLDKYTFHQDD